MRVVFLNDNDVQNIITTSRLARVKIVDDFIKMANVNAPYDFTDDTYLFAEKYQGKTVNVMKQNDEWFIIEDNNIVVPLSCIEEWYPRPLFLINRINEQ